MRAQVARNPPACSGSLLTTKYNKKRADARAGRKESSRLKRVPPYDKKFYQKKRQPEEQKCAGCNRENPGRKIQ